MCSTQSRLTQPKSEVSQNFMIELAPLGFPDQVDHTLIIYGTIQIIRFFFYDLTMINVQSYRIQSVVNLEPRTSMVPSETIYKSSLES